MEVNYFSTSVISRKTSFKDGRRFYENGLATPNAPSPEDTTIWGRVPRNPIQVTNAFSNIPEDRLFQDIGFDGLNDENERTKRQAYLDQLATTFGTGSAIYQEAGSFQR